MGWTCVKRANGVGRLLSNAIPPRSGGNSNFRDAFEFQTGLGEDGALKVFSSRASEGLFTNARRARLWHPEQPKARELVPSQNNRFVSKPADHRATKDGPFIVEADRF